VASYRTARSRRLTLVDHVMGSSSVPRQLLFNLWRHDLRRLSRRHRHGWRLRPGPPDRMHLYVCVDIGVHVIASAGADQPCVGGT
jgi:hypothetical protein